LKLAILSSIYEQTLRDVEFVIDIVETVKLQSGKEKKRTKYLPYK